MNKTTRSLCILICLSTIFAACQPQVRITEKEIVITSIATKYSTALSTHTALSMHTPYPTSTHIEVPSIPTYSLQTSYTPQATYTNADPIETTAGKTITETAIIPTNTSIAVPATSNVSTESPQDSQTDVPPINTQEPTSALTVTFASTPPTIEPADIEIIQMPSILDITSGIPDYSRSEWSHWSDDDRDCQNTRHEVLVTESISSVSFKSTNQCQVNIGLWYDPFVGTTVSVASELDVDHMIPLHNAHFSGGWMWSASVKKAFANDLSDADHLIAVTASANRSKGSKAPNQWKPPNQAYWCEYAKDWTRIKYNWGLTVTTSEYYALQEMLSTCTENINIEHGSGNTPNIILQEINASEDNSECTCTGNTLNCSDFSTHAEAQACYQQCGGTTNDIHRLDGDKDGSACESLP